MVTASLYARTRAWAISSDTVRRWRQRRYQLFLELCKVGPDESILDVGAGRGGALERFNRTNPIVAVDLKPDTSEWLSAPNVEVRVGDGTNLGFGHGEFGAVFSSSVIEHVPKDLQEAFASEIRRVGRRYFVQTPNRYFPIEPTTSSRSSSSSLAGCSGLSTTASALGGSEEGSGRRSTSSRRVTSGASFRTPRSTVSGSSG